VGLQTIVSQLFSGSLKVSVLVMTMNFARKKSPLMVTDSI